MYELWILRILLETISEILKREWKPHFEDRGAVKFIFDGGAPVVTLYYNYTKLGAFRKFDRYSELRPDFLLTCKSPRDSDENSEEIVLIADAKYKHKPDTGDLERMLAYLLWYSWEKPEDVATGMFLYIGTRGRGGIENHYERISNPTAKIHYLCARQNGAQTAGREELREIIKNISRDKIGVH